MRLDEIRNSAKKQEAVKGKLASVDFNVPPDNLKDAIASYVSPDDLDEFVFILKNGLSDKQSDDPEMIYRVIDNLAKKLSIQIEMLSGDTSNIPAKMRKSGSIYSLVGDMSAKFYHIRLRKQIPGWPEELNDSGANYMDSGKECIYQFRVSVAISHNTKEGTWKFELWAPHSPHNALPKSKAVNFKKVFEDGPRMLDFMIPVLTKIRSDMQVYDDFIAPHAHKAIRR